VKCTDTFLFWQKNAGFGKIGEKVVQHQARKYGNQIWNGTFHQWIPDLITIWFLSIWKKTNAFIWCHGIANVHHWFYCGLHWRFNYIICT
jgi:hypothetical protein